MKSEIRDFLEDIGSVLVTDSENNFLYSNNKIILSEKAQETWKFSSPEARLGQKNEIWEFLDADKKKYYQITTSTFAGESGLCQMHYLVDVTEYTKVFQNISAMTLEWEEMSRFQTAMLNHLSGDYISILPDIANIFHTEKIMLCMRTEYHSEKFLFDKKQKSVSKSEIVEQEIFSLKAEDCYHGFFCFLNEKVANQQYCILVKDGKRFAAEKLKDASLHNIIYLFIENSILKAKIIYESEHDKLTGLYNKGKYMALFKENFGNPRSIAIFNMDVNNLKKMNDTYGHEMGDKLIIKAAESLRMIESESESIHGFRMGGDEFMLIAQNLSFHQALLLKEKWEQAVDSLNQLNDDIPLVIACGLAYGEKDYLLTDLLKQADELMYEDKKRKKAQ